MSGNKRQPRQRKQSNDNTRLQCLKDKQRAQSYVINVSNKVSNYSQETHAYKDHYNEHVEHAKLVRPKLKLWLEEIQKKQRSTREEALTSLVDTLRNAPKHKFVKDNVFTIFHVCLTRLTTKKNGSSNFSKVEVRLAVRAISLVALTIIDEDRSFEVYEECLPVLTGVLDRFEEFEVDTVIEVLSCLGFLGFFGSRNSMEMEKVIFVVWNFIMNFPNNTNNKPKILGEAINTLSFLLTRIHKWKVNYKYWRTSISYLANLLKINQDDDNNHVNNDYEIVKLAAMDALALIFDMEFFKNLSLESKQENDFNCLLLEQEIKSKFILENSDYLNYNDNKVPQIIQYKITKSFLGSKGFACHIKHNESFERLFEFVSNRDDNEQDEETVYEPEREELVMKFYRREVGKVDPNDLLPFFNGKEKDVHKRMGMSPSSCLNKARTQLLCKQRHLKNKFFIENELYD